MITRGATFVSRLAVFLSALFVFTACGGGGGGSTFYEGEDDDPIFTIALLNAQGEKITTVTSGAPATVRAKFSKDGDNVLVSASTTVGSLLPSTGTALTNDDGVAYFTLQIAPGTPKGAGVVTATAEGLTASIDFEVGESGLRLGYFDEQGNFIENEIGISPDTMLSAQGRAQLSLAVLTEDGDLVDEPQDVIFSSPCLSSGLAMLDPTSPVTTINGQVSTSYIAAGCSGTDEISAAVAGASGQAFGTIEIAPPEASGLVFVAVDPATIAVKGTGGLTERPESSTVTFRVVDSNGNPLQGVRVQFELNSTASGATLSPDSALSTTSGQAITTVSASDVAGIVRVVASIETEDGNTISNISDTITISTGLPVQSGISLSLAPGEGFVVENGMTQDGVERTLTVTMLDSFNKPVANGTQASFETEYGSIDLTCKTGVENGTGISGDQTPPEGKCSVLWTSSNPREPNSQANQDAVQTIFNNSSYNCPGLNSSSGACPGDLGYTHGGRSTVKVVALGQETFTDTNNNGVMDPEESDSFVNLPESFLDKNEDDAYTPALCASGGGTTRQCRAGSEETWDDLNLNGVYDQSTNPTWYNGLACPTEGDGVYCTRELVDVRADTVLILSAPELGLSQQWDVQLTAGSSPVTRTNQNGNYKAYFSDLYNNRPPAGSTIAVSATGGCRTSATSFTVSDSVAPGAFAIDVDLEPALVGPELDGSVVITLSPAGGTDYTETFPCDSLCADLNNPAENPDTDPPYCPNPAP